MNYIQAKEFLIAAQRFGSIPGLSSITALLNELGDPQEALKFIHISGTNGKGSALAYISSILKCAGYKVGRYISPTIFSYRERIQINEEYISHDELCLHAFEVKCASERMIEKGMNHPTAFELETAIAFLHFAKQNCDIVVLESGMGGLLDATNIINNTLCAVITSISLDHIEYLGDTLEKIAFHKAGIIKQGCEAVLYGQSDAVQGIIEKACSEKNAHLTIASRSNAENCGFDSSGQFFDYKQFKQLRIRLMGDFQFNNAALAIEACLALRRKGLSISDEAIYNGMANAVWRARFEKIMEKPIFILDGAHNEDAAIALVDSLQKYYPNKKYIYIMGVFKDKDFNSIIRIAAPLANYIFAVASNSPRALPANELCSKIAHINKNVSACQSIAQAVESALSLAEQDGIIIAMGTLSHLGDIYKYVCEKGGLK